MLRTYVLEPLAVLLFGLLVLGTRAFAIVASRPQRPT